MHLSACTSRARQVYVTLYLSRNTSAPVQKDLCATRRAVAARVKLASLHITSRCAQVALENDRRSRLRTITTEREVVLQLKNGKRRHYNAIQ